MWTVDSRCAQCAHKEACQDRPEMIRTLSSMTNKLNTDEAFAGKGDGVIVMVCRDFEV